MSPSGRVSVAAASAKEARRRVVDPLGQRPMSHTASTTARVNWRVSKPPVLQTAKERFVTSRAMAIQMAACTPNFLILESFVDEDDLRRKSTTVPFPVVDGYLDVPEGPGLGTDLIEDVLDEYPSSEASWSSDGWWPA